MLFTAEKALFFAGNKKRIQESYLLLEMSQITKQKPELNRSDLIPQVRLGDKDLFFSDAVYEFVSPENNLVINKCR